MNPELLRNVWVELSERRLTLLLVVVGSMLLLGLTPGDLGSAVSVAEITFYGIVVVWGTRCAAQMVTDEVVSKTWDAQRLSAIRPWTMVWGKLFGATLLIWLGGAMCLAVILYAAVIRGGASAALRELIYFVGMGVLAHSVAMLASLAAVRRRLGHGRFGVFLYQSLGLLAGFAVWRVWQTASPDSLFRRFSGLDALRVDSIGWWTQNYDAGTFYVVSLALFAGWTLLGNYRLMRTELQVRNGPWIWIAFLAYAAVFTAGFDPWRDYVLSPTAALGLRAIQAAFALALVTYVMAFVEPKESVAYRWLGQRFFEGRILAFLGRLPAWVYAYAATFVAGVVAMLFMPWGQAAATFSSLGQGASVIAAALGFLLRDCGIFLVFGMGQTERRSDLAAVAVIALLYFLLPGVLGGAATVGVFFYPGAHDPAWLNPLLGWLQAGVAWAIIFRRPDLRATSPS